MIIKYFAVWHTVSVKTHCRKVAFNQGLHCLPTVKSIGTEIHRFLGNFDQQLLKLVYKMDNFLLIVSLCLG